MDHCTLINGPFMDHCTLINGPLYTNYERYEVEFPLNCKQVRTSEAFICDTLYVDKTLEVFVSVPPCRW